MNDIIRYKYEEEPQLEPTSDAPRTLAEIAPIANAYAVAGAFTEYTRELTNNSRRAQRSDLETFCTFLATISIEATASELMTEPTAWTGLDHGIVKAFREWLLKQGFAISTSNRKLGTIRIYAALAYSAGVLNQDQHLRIQQVHGYSRGRALNLDASRQEEGLPTRIGRKGEGWPALKPIQCRQLLEQSDDPTPQGRRDHLLICLALEHGLRAGELADLQVENFNLDTDPATMTFYRKKVKMKQTHKLEERTRLAAKTYFRHHDALPGGPLLRASRKDGILTTAGMSEQAIYNRVRLLGETILHVTISPHTLRHTWATVATQNGTSIAALQKAGGWSSPAMAIRYFEVGEIANEDVNIHY